MDDSVTLFGLRRHSLWDPDAINCASLDKFDKHQSLMQTRGMFMRMQLAADLTLFLCMVLCRYMSAVRRQLLMSPAYWTRETSITTLHLELVSMELVSNCLLATLYRPEDSASPHWQDQRRLRMGCNFTGGLPRTNTRCSALDTLVADYRIANTSQVNHLPTAPPSLDVIHLQVLRRFSTHRCNT